MEIHQLRYFSVLAKELNYTSAAEKCYISRQALRQSVQSIEKEYGAVLIENRRNRLFLTPAGELLAGWAQKLTADWDGMETALHRFISEPLQLRLGISVSLLPFYAPEQLERLFRVRTLFPSLMLEDSLADADTLLSWLRAGALDAALLIDMGVDRPGLERIVLRRDDLWIMVGSGHPYSSRQSLCLRDLDGQTLSVMSTAEDCFAPLCRALGSAGVHTRFRVIPESYDAFAAVRKEGILAMDRSSPDAAPAVSLEKDLPLTDFSVQLETVLLVRESASRSLRPVLRRLQDSLQP